jgi:hypothetical protein
LVQKGEIKLKEKIFKVQRPLNHYKSVLIYDETREVYIEIALTDSMKKLMGEEYKIYVKGYIDAGGILHINNKTMPQKW